MWVMEGEDVGEGRGEGGTVCGSVLVPLVPVHAMCAPCSPIVSTQSSRHRCSHKQHIFWNLLSFDTSCTVSVALV